MRIQRRHIRGSHENRRRPHTPAYTLLATSACSFIPLCRARCPGSNCLSVSDRQQYIIMSSNVAAVLITGRLANANIARQHSSRHGVGRCSDMGGRVLSGHRPRWGRVWGPPPHGGRGKFFWKMAISCILSGDHNIAVACRQRETVQ